MFKRIIQVVFLLGVLFSFSSSKADATIIFQDNFDLEIDNTFPSNWHHFITPGTSCSSDWIIKSGKVGIKIENQACNSNIVPKDTVWPSLLQNYVLEADITLVNGTDHNIGFKTDMVNLIVYEIHFQAPNDFVISAPGPVNIINYVNDPHYVNGQTYHLKTTVNNRNIKVEVNGVFVKELTAGGDFPLGKIALRAGTGGDTNSETWFDNVRVTTLDHQDSLEVPEFKQTENPWGPTLYDSANLWAGSNNDMSRWGCAVTSAAMVFKYHGIEKMPDNSDLDPGTLNAWLKSQPDGYVLNGYVNWLALSRLSLLSKPNNSYDGFDALEYNRIGGENKTQLIDDITNKIPGILEEPGHFIVAKGEDVANSSFLINDPYYSRDSLLDYGNTFLSLGRFIPSQTDLSYIMFVVDKDININLKDSNGNEVGESYIQEPIINPLGDSEGGSAIKMLYLQKPADGNYSLEVSSPSTANYLLDGYLYDKDGKVKKIDLNGVVGVGDVDTYQITQNKENINQGGIKQVVTFDSLKRDITLFYKAGKIRNFGKYAAWTTQVDQAKFISKFSKKGAKAILQALKKQITSEKKAIDSVSKSILLNEIGILISYFFFLIPL